MVNNQNFKFSNFIKNSIMVEIFPFQKRMTRVQKTNPTGSFENNEKHGVEYLVLKCATVFVETLNSMFLDAKMLHLYKHFVLHKSSLLSSY